MLKDDPVPVTAEADLLGQGATIETLVAAVGALPPPACIALYGAWGTGKTNILQNAMTRVRAAHHLPVWFDPWHYDQQDDLLGPLIRTLLVETRKLGLSHPERRARFVEAAVSLAKTVSLLAARVGVRALANTALPLPAPSGGAAAPLISASDTSAARLEEWLGGKGEAADEIERVKTRFARLVKAILNLKAVGREPPENHRLVFFLDDLDRCLPNRTLALIEQIKLLLCGAAGCEAIFVFALDRQIVGEAIRNQFAGATQYTGENYLEKIFDLSLEAPPVPADPERVAPFVRACAKSLGGLDQLCSAFSGAGPLIAALSLPPLANPRVIKRALNRLKLLSRQLGSSRPFDAVDDPDAARRCLTWLAGAERFRVVRLALRATDARVFERVLQRLRGDRSAEDLLGDSAQLLRLPGLSIYLGALGLDRGANAKRERERFYGDEPVTPGSLRWFDDLMRSAGL